jgi:DNA-binding transcriptional ArsR family regulator
MSTPENPPDRQPTAARTVTPGGVARGGVVVHPDDVTLQVALEALADPVRRKVVRSLAEVPDWSMPCGAFDLGVSKATSSHHFAVLRAAGLLEQRDSGTRRLNRLRRPEFEARFPGLLDLVLSDHRP